ncbi:MAG: lipid-binding SYLF domain-containing protein [Casimicrobiaceae bacterium]
MQINIDTPRAAKKWLALMAMTTVVGISAPAIAQEQQALVTSAQSTFQDFLRDPDMNWFRANVNRARGVLIAPEILKVGWIFGGSGGRAVLYARNAQGKWEGPAFYNIGAASVGFQAGLSVSQTVTLVMTEKGLNTLLANSVKLGGDASIAAGPVGAGANSDVTTDFVAFSRSKGLYGGLNLEGSVISPANDWNNAYYGKTVLPPDIVVRGAAHNAQGDALAADIGRAAAIPK